MMTFDDSERSAGARRFRCKWCNGSGVVQSGKRCISCKGRGWYEDPPTASAALGATVGALVLSVALWWIGGPGWSVIADGLAIFCLGVGLVSLAIVLRGPEEQGWNGLMLLGTLLAAFGLLSIPLGTIFS